MKFLLENSKIQKNEDKDFLNTCVIAIGEIAKAICTQLGYERLIGCLTVRSKPMIPFIPEIIEILQNGERLLF